jgi:drug/metabolite transporter (DMT)-like permease
VHETPPTALPPRSRAKFRHHLLADVNLLLVALIWGVNMPIMKFALSRMDEFLFNAYRLTLSAIVLGLFSWWQRARLIDRTEFAKPIARQWFNIIAFALFTGFGYQVLFLLGIKATSATNTAFIMSAIPVWIAVLAFFLLKERLGHLAWIGLAVALAGTLIVTLGKQQSGMSVNSLAGNLLVSAAAFSWALGSVISRPIMKNISPIALAFFAIGATVPLHLMIAGHVMWQTPDLFSDPLLLAALLYSGVFSTGLAYAMWNYGVKVIGPGQAAGFQNLVPLIAMFSSWLMIGEVPFAMQLLGGALIISGLAVMRTRRV